MFADLFEEFSVFFGIAPVRTGADKGDRPQAVLNRRGVSVSVYAFCTAADDDRAWIVFPAALYTGNAFFLVFSRAAPCPHDCDPDPHVRTVDEGFVFPPSVKFCRHIVRPEGLPLLIEVDSKIRVWVEQFRLSLTVHKDRKI